jgi:hypothetical protein
VSQHAGRDVTVSPDSLRLSAAVEFVVVGSTASMPPRRVFRHTWRDKLTSVPIRRKALWAENNQLDRKGQREVRDSDDPIGRSRPTGLFVL